jgi:hypothetical protein
MSERAAALSGVLSATTWLVREMSGASVTVNVRDQYTDSDCKSCDWFERGATMHPTGLQHAMTEGHTVEIKHVTVSVATAESGPGV